MINSIAIAFADNDFENTFRPLLEFVYRTIDYNPRLLDDEKRVVNMIFEQIPFFYKYYQNGDGKSYTASTIYHLSQASICFNEDADKLCSSSRTFWYLDMTTGKVSSFY